MKSIINKIKQNLVKIALLATGAILMTSCQEEIDLKLDDDFTRIVVEGAITDEAKAHEVILTKTTSYFYSEVPPPVTGAKVTITDGNFTFNLTENPVGSGKYYTDPSVKGVPGRTYTLKIENVDLNADDEMETYTAETIMRKTMAMDTVIAEPYEPGDLNSDYGIYGWAHEDPEPGNCYQWVYYKNGVLESDTLDETNFTDDEFVNGNYIQGFEVFWDVKAKPGDTIVVETRSITEEYLTYMFELMSQTSWNAGNFGGPPANVFGNISDGGLGYFNAYSISKNYTVIP